jgi:DNA-binding ferritin-like protein
MEITIAEFDQRVVEVESYFAFLESALKNKAALSFEEADKPKIQIIDSELQKILKANSFILLYNLVESSFKSTLEKLCDDINHSQARYENAIPAIRKIWLQYDQKYFTVHPKGTVKLDYVYEIIDDIANQILRLPENLDGMIISGNLDSQKIKEYAKIYGIESEALHRKSCIKLFTVKNQRNALAHGNISFTQCGRDYDYSQLNEMKEAIINYMEFILKEFKRNIDQKYYISAA